MYERKLREAKMGAVITQPQALKQICIRVESYLWLTASRNLLSRLSRNMQSDKDKLSHLA